MEQQNPDGQSLGASATSFGFLASFSLQNLSSFLVDRDLRKIWIRFMCTTLFSVCLCVSVCVHKLNGRLVHATRLVVVVVVVAVVAKRKGSQANCAHLALIFFFEELLLKATAILSQQLVKLAHSSSRLIIRMRIKNRRLN